MTHDGGDDNAGDHDDFVDQQSMTPTSSSPVSGLKKWWAFGLQEWLILATVGKIPILL